MTRVHTLANGLRIVADPLPGFQTFALTVAAGRGARAEDATQGGWSHLLEHMVFKGAGQRSARDIVEVIEARGGGINAATGYERTSFQVRSLAGALPLGLEVVADLILRPTLDAADLAREVGVIAQEIAEADDTPDDFVFELAQGSAFADQPLGRPVLGTEAAIAAADPAALEAWRARLYAPDRLVVSAAGAFEEAELIEIATRLFGDAAPAGATAAPPPAEFTGGPAAEVRQAGAGRTCVLYLPGLGATDPDYYAMRLFAEILGGGMSSRLFQEAREKLGLAYAIDAFAESYQDTGLLGVYAGCAAKDAGELAKVAADQIQALASGVTSAELDRAKTQLKASLFMARESLAARAEQAAAQLLVMGRLLTPEEIAAAIDGVTEAQVRAIVARVLAAKRSAPAVLGPKRALAAADTFHRALFG